MNIYSNNGQYASPLPYPSATGVSEDQRFARMLEPSRIGELNAISEYIYQSIIFGDVYPWLSTMFEGIAMTEMRHFQLLSELVYYLGLNPAVNARVRNIPYDISQDTGSAAPVAARRAVQANIADEKSAGAEYRRLADVTNDRVASEILRRIADDEEIHARLLESAYKKIPMS